MYMFSGALLLFNDYSLEVSTFFFFALGIIWMRKKKMNERKKKIVEDNGCLYGYSSIVHLFFISVNRCNECIRSSWVFVLEYGIPSFISPIVSSILLFYSLSQEFVFFFSLCLIRYTFNMRMKRELKRKKNVKTKNFCNKNLESSMKKNKYRAK